MKKILVIFLVFVCSFGFSQKQEKYYDVFLKNIISKYQSKSYLIKEKNVAIKLLAETVAKITNEKVEKNSPFSEALQIAETGNIDKAIERLSDTTISKTDKRCMLLKARFYVINLQFVEADDVYEKLAIEKSNDFETLVEYAAFCDAQNMLSLAKHYYEESLIVAKNEADEANTFQRLSNLYLKQAKYEVAADYCNSAVCTYQRLVNKKKGNYTTSLAEANLLFGKIKKGLGKNDEAKTAYLQSINSYESIKVKTVNEQSKLADVYFAYGSFLFSIRSTESIGYFSKSLTIKEELAAKNAFVYSASLAESYNSICIVHREKGRYKEAATYIQKAIDVYTSISKDNNEYLPRIAELQNNLAVIYSDLNMNDLAMKTYLNASETYSKLAENNNIFEIGVANVQVNLGLLYKDVKKFQQSYDAYDKALAIYTTFSNVDKQKYLPDVALTLNNLGILFDEIDQNEKALESFQKAIVIRKELASQNNDNYLISLVSSLINIGNIYYKRGNIDSALVNFENAENTYQKQSSEERAANSADLANLYNNIGNLYRNIKKFDKAKTNYLKAMALNKKLAAENSEKLVEVAETDNNLALLFYDTNNLDSAQFYTNLALDIQTKLAEKDTFAIFPRIAITYNNLGKIHLKAGKLEAASQVFNKAFAITHDLAQRNTYFLSNEISSLLVLSDFYIKSDKLTDAADVNEKLVLIYENLSQKVPDVYTKKEADTYNNLAIIYSAVNQFEKALDAAEKALKLYQGMSLYEPERFNQDVARTYHSMGNIYSDLSKFDKAGDSYERALKIRIDLASKNVTYNSFVADTYMNQGLLYSKMLLNDKAINTYKQAYTIYVSKDIEQSQDNFVKASMSLINIGFVYQHMIKKTPKKEYKEAGLKYTNESLDLLQKHPETEQAQKYMELAIQLKGFFSTFITE